MRIVGHQDRNEFETDPAKAWHRGRQLDTLLSKALPERPQGVWRACHEEFNRVDDAWHLAIARRLNSGPAAPLAGEAPAEFRERHAS